MTAIFKRELKSYLTSMVGYLFIFFVLVLTGIYFSAYQLSGGYSKFETTLSALTFVFLLGYYPLVKPEFASVTGYAQHIVNRRIDRPCMNL